MSPHRILSPENHQRHILLLNIHGYYIREHQQDLTHNILFYLSQLYIPPCSFFQQSYMKVISCKI